MDNYSKAEINNRPKAESIVVIEELFDGVTVSASVLDVFLQSWCGNRDVPLDHFRLFAEHLAIGRIKEVLEIIRLLGGVEFLELRRGLLSVQSQICSLAIDDDGKFNGCKSDSIDLGGPANETDVKSCSHKTIFKVLVTKHFDQSQNCRIGKSHKKEKIEAKTALAVQPQPSTSTRVNKLTC